MCIGIPCHCDDQQQPSHRWIVQGVKQGSSMDTLKVMVLCLIRFSWESDIHILKEQYSMFYCLMFFSEWISMNLEPWDSGLCSEAQY